VFRVEAIVLRHFRWHLEHDQLRPLNEINIPISCPGTLLSQGSAVFPLKWLDRDTVKRHTSRHVCLDGHLTSTAPSTLLWFPSTSSTRSSPAIVAIIIGHMPR
jgi:hypothetical protein